MNQASTATLLGLRDTAATSSERLLTHSRDGGVFERFAAMESQSRGRQVHCTLTTPLTPLPVKCPGSQPSVVGWLLKSVKHL